MSNPARRLGAAWYFLPVFVFVICVVLVPVGIIVYTVRQNPSGIEMVVPGDKEIEIQKPGSYVLWDEVNTIYRGQTYSSSGQLPTGVQIHLTKAGTTNEVMIRSGLNARMSVGRTVRQSVGIFDLVDPGKYRLSVQGQFPQRVFYFRNSMFDEVFMILSAVGIGALGFLASLILAAIIFFKRRASRA